MEIKKVLILIILGLVLFGSGYCDSSGSTSSITEINIGGNGGSPILGSSTRYKLTKTGGDWWIQETSGFSSHEYKFKTVTQKEFSDLELNQAQFNEIQGFIKKVDEKPIDKNVFSEDFLKKLKIYSIELKDEETVLASYSGNNIPDVYFKPSTIIIGENKIQYVDPTTRIETTTTNGKTTSQTIKSEKLISEIITEGGKKTEREYNDGELTKEIVSENGGKITTEYQSERKIITQESSTEKTIQIFDTGDKLIQERKGFSNNDDSSSSSTELNSDGTISETTQNGDIRIEKKYDSSGKLLSYVSLEYQIERQSDGSLKITDGGGTYLYNPDTNKYFLDTAEIRNPIPNLDPKNIFNTVYGGGVGKIKNTNSNPKEASSEGTNVGNSIPSENSPSKEGSTLQSETSTPSAQSECKKGVYNSKDGLCYDTTENYNYGNGIRADKTTVYTPQGIVYEKATNQGIQESLKVLRELKAKGKIPTSLDSESAKIAKKILDNEYLSYSEIANLPPETIDYLAKSLHQNALDAFEIKYSTADLELQKKIYSETTDIEKLKKIFEIEIAPELGKRNRNGIQEICKDNLAKCTSDLIKIGKVEVINQYFSPKEQAEAFKTLSEDEAKNFLLGSISSTNFDTICSGDEKKCQQILMTEAMSNGEFREKARDKLKTKITDGSLEITEDQAADLVLTSGSEAEKKEFAQAYNGLDCSSFFQSIWCSITGKNNANQLIQKAVQKSVSETIANTQKISVPKEVKDNFCDTDKSVAECQTKYNKCQIEKKSDDCKNVKNFERDTSLYSSYGKLDDTTVTKLNQDIKVDILGKLNLQGSYSEKVNSQIEELEKKLKENSNSQGACNPDDQSSLGCPALYVEQDKLNQEIDELKKSKKTNIPYKKINEIAEKCKEMDDTCNNVIQTNCVNDKECIITVKQALEEADKNTPVRVGWTYSIIDAIKNPDQSGLKTAKLFGFEANYENVPEMLRESVPSQMCLDKIDGYLDKEMETNGGVTKYGCDSYDASTEPDKHCLEVMGDLRAQRSSITPDNKTLVTYSYYVKNPENPFSLSVKYVQQGNWRVFTLENSSSTKGFDSVNIPLNDSTGIEPNSFTINLDSGDLHLTYPIVLISTGALKSTLETNGNAAGNEGANINANING